MDFGIVSQAISSSFYVSGTVVGSKGKKKSPVLLQKLYSSKANKKMA